MRNPIIDLAPLAPRLLKAINAAPRGGLVVIGE
jgi:hypothetical protein